MKKIKRTAFAYAISAFLIIGTGLVAKANQSHLQSMIQKALNHGCPIILATIPPVISNEYRNRSAQAARIREFNPSIYSIANTYGIPVARVYDFLTSISNWENKLMDQPTANHPNDAGYLYVRDAFFQQVAAGIEAGTYY